MPTLLPTVDHLAIGVSKIAEQYKGKPRITLWILCFLQQVQYIEDAIAATVNVWDPDTAIGWRLEKIGERVGQKRIGLNDNVYRLFIRARIRANRSIGKIKDLIDVANILIGQGAYSYSETTGNVYIETQTSWSADEMTAIHTLLQRAAPGGVRVWFRASVGGFPYRAFVRRATRQPVDVPGGYQARTYSEYISGLYVSVRS